MHDFLEQADPGLRFRVPVVEDLRQPVRIRRARRGHGPPGRRVQPGTVRQQEVDLRRSEVGERPVRPDRIVVQVDGAQQAAVQVREPAESLQRGGHRPVAPAAARVPPVQVVGIGVAVDADADADLELVEEFQVGAAQPDAVGLHGRVHGDAWTRAAPG